MGVTSQQARGIITTPVYFAGFDTLANINTTCADQLRRLPVTFCPSRGLSAVCVMDNRVSSLTFIPITRLFKILINIFSHFSLSVENPVLTISFLILVHTIAFSLQARSCISLKDSIARFVTLSPQNDRFFCISKPTFLR